MKNKVLSSCLALTLTLSMLAVPVNAASASSVSLAASPLGRIGENVYQNTEDTVLSKCKAAELWKRYFPRPRRFTNNRGA